MSTTHGAVTDTEPEILVVRDDTMATVTLNRPDALNAITPTMLVTLGDELDRLATDDAVRVVVLTGAGRAFSAGVDLKALGDRELINGTVGDILDLPARRVTDRLSTMAAITVAKVNGFCFTGALELAIACDIVVAAEEAKFGDTHAKFGLRPTWGMSQRLPRLVGVAAARGYRELGFSIAATSGTAAALRAAGVEVDTDVAKLGEMHGVHAVALIREGKVQMVVNSPRGRGPRADGEHIRSAAGVANVPLLTTAAAAIEAAKGLRDWAEYPLAVRSLQEYHRGVSASELGRPSSGGGM